MQSIKKFAQKKLQVLINGQSLVELLLAIAFASIVLPILIVPFISSREGKPQQRQRVQAVTLLKEAQEAVRSIRENGWPALASDGTYHPVATVSAWTLVPGMQVANGYTRWVTIESVTRDASTGAIVTSGGIVDASTKKVTANVSWSGPTGSSVSAAMYLTRYLGNLSHVETTQAQFNSGTQTSVNVTNTSGGEIVLATNTKGQWCGPNLSLAAVSLPGVPNAVYATEGNIYAATGQTAQSSQDSFAHVLVANTDPPSSSLQGKLQGYQTNAVFGEPGWGYIATTNNTKEVVIVNLNQFDDVPNKILHEQGYFDARRSASTNETLDGHTIFVTKDVSNNDRGYMTAGHYLYVFDLSSKTGSRPRVGNRIQFANSGDKAGEIYVRNVGSRTYVFIAVEGSTPEELKIADVTNPSSGWGIVGDINIEPNNCSALESGKAIYTSTDGTRAYISSTNDTSFKEFFSINTTSKTNPSLVGGFASNPPCTNGGGYEAGGMDPEQSVVVPGVANRAILVGRDTPNDGINSQEYQVLDLTNEANPSKCGGLQLDQGVYGVAAVKEADGDAYAYIITGDATNQLKIIQGGPDGVYLDAGVLESAVFNAGYQTVFNRISASTTLPAQTSVQFQVAVADPVSGSCASADYQYVGPDGTPATYFPASGGVIPQDNNGSGYENPGQCFRYKVFLATTNYNATPVVNDVSINYSP